MHGEQNMNNANVNNASAGVSLHGTDDWEINLMYDYMKRADSSVREYAQKRISALKRRSA